MGPAGRSAVTFAETAFCPCSPVVASSNARTGGTPSNLCNMNIHLIDGVIKIAARIPYRRYRLRASLVVCRARLNDVVAGFARLPIVTPEAPRVVRLITAE